LVISLKKDNTLFLICMVNGYMSVKNQNGKFIDKLNTIYIGYEPREQEAVDVLIDTIKTASSYPLNIVTLNMTALRRIGLYRRAPDTVSTCWGEKQDGVMRDAFDKKPFSTEFSFTRFLVPHLNQYEGFALFMDCDMFFTADPCELFRNYATDDAPPVQVVQHNYEKSEDTKMYGCPQTNYSRKNWSSFMLWNCGHPSNLNLTVDDVNTKSGNWLHNFKWLNDDEIGSLPEEWNWLDGHSDPDIYPKNIHFTTGGPWFETWVPKRDIDEHYAKKWKIYKNVLGINNVK
jgi:hypothetical protein